jgi:hypothetical protein
MRRRLAALVVLLLIAAGRPAPAAVLPFEAKAFADAQAAGRGIAVFVHAPW